MQILISLIVFVAGFVLGYLYGYYIRSRRAIRSLNANIERTIQEQEQLRAQYNALRKSLIEIKQQQRLRTTISDLHIKQRKRLR